MRCPASKIEVQTPSLHSSKAKVSRPRTGWFSRSRYTRHLLLNLRAGDRRMLTHPMQDGEVL